MFGRPKIPVRLSYLPPPQMLPIWKSSAFTQIWEDVDRVWNGFPDLQKSEEFKRKCALRKMELAQSKKDLKAVYDAYPEYQKNAEFLAKLTQFKSRLV